MGRWDWKTIRLPFGAKGLFSAEKTSREYASLMFFFERVLNFLGGIQMKIYFGCCPNPVTGG